MCVNISSPILINKSARANQVGPEILAYSYANVADAEESFEIRDSHSDIFVYYQRLHIMWIIIEVHILGQMPALNRFPRLITATMLVDQVEIFA